MNTDELPEGITFCDMMGSRKTNFRGIGKSMLEQDMHPEAG
jgi:hypothetical protein